MKKASILAITIVLIIGSAIMASAVARSRGHGHDRGPEAAAEPTANQILDQEEAQIAAIKARLRLKPDQEKNWSDLESSLRDIAKKRADRMVVMRSEIKKQKDNPPSLIEQWRGVADVLNDRSIDLKTMADAADPLYASLDEQQKKDFKDEFAKLERSQSGESLKEAFGR